ncbi:MAG TPA: hypothetical protein VGG10_15020 [Rhizomicrobium sp.]
MTQIWDTCLYSAGTLNVLLAMADHASDDGRDIYPGIDYLAAKCRQSPRATFECIRRLRSDGVVHLLGSRGEDLPPIAKAAGGRGRKTQYRIDLRRLREQQLAHCAEEPDCVHCLAGRKAAETTAFSEPRRDTAKGDNSGVKGEENSAKDEISRAHIENHQNRQRTSLTREASQDAGGDVVWKPLWIAFREWPGLPGTASEALARGAWGRRGADWPSDGELLDCIRAHGRKLAADNARRPQRLGAVLPVLPHNWLERDRGWQDHLAEVRARPAKIAQSVERAIAIEQRLGSRVYGALVRGLGLSDGEIETWFGDAVFTIADGRVRIDAGNAVKAARLRERYALKLERAFALPVDVIDASSQHLEAAQ